MVSERDDVHGESHWLALAELADLAGLSETEVHELVEYGALSPEHETGGHWQFSMHAVTIARTARRLGVEYDLEPPGVALLLAYLERIHELEAEVCALKALLPR
jgi:DNA-binding IclR family transcriptional regulator